MVWGTQAGISDLVAKVKADDTNTKSLVIMRGRKFGATEAQQLADALKSNSNLQELYASGHDIGTVGAGALGRALKQNTSLQTLCIGNADTCDAGMQALIDGGLAENTSLLRLALDYKGLTQGAHIAALLTQHPKLQQIDLSRNTFTSDGFTDLCAGLSNTTTLQSLNLSGLGGALDKATAKVLGRSLPQSLISLDISENDLQGSAGIQFLNSLAGIQHTKLTTLVMRDCSMGPSVCAALGNAVQSLVNLTKLDLAGNGLTDAGIAACSLPHLQWLSLARNEIRLDDWMHLGAWSQAKHLKFLDLSSNGINCNFTTAEDFLKNLVNGSHLKHLTELRLYGNQLGNAGAQVLHDGLRASATVTDAQGIQTLDVCANGLDGLGVALLVIGSHVSKSIKTLELGGNTIDALAESVITKYRSEHAHIDISFRADGQSNNPSSSTTATAADKDTDTPPMD